jgi:PD-(D/E)XK nuclease superfamily
MKDHDVNQAELLAVLDELPARFHTRDVSNHPRMLAGHAACRGDVNYHAMIGKALSRLADPRGSPTVSKAGGLGDRGGQLWERLTPDLGDRGQVRPSTRPAESSSTGAGPQGSHIDIGPQYAGDSVFAARMRRHQSWYRTVVLKVPYGTGPGRHSMTSYGNCLTAADGDRGLNFLTPAIFEVARHRLQQRHGAVEPYRLLCNMLSSQPMCFNLFGPLVDDLTLATMLLQRLLPGRVERVLRVEIEFAPQPASEYLADRTAFDAFIEYCRPDGKLGCLGVETKLSEPFSPGRYDILAYCRWMQGPESPFLPEADARVASVRHNQLWRDHLLALAMRDHPSSKYSESSLLLVRHPRDSTCAKITADYQRLLRGDGNTFIDLPLDELVSLWMQAPLTTAQESWMSGFQRRYLDLDASEPGDALPPT